MKTTPRVDPLENIVVLRGFAMTMIFSRWIHDSRDLFTLSRTHMTPSRGDPLNWLVQFWEEVLSEGCDLDCRPQTNTKPITNM